MIGEEQTVSHERRTADITDALARHGFQLVREEPGPVDADGTVGPGTTYLAILYRAKGREDVEPRRYEFDLGGARVTEQKWDGLMTNFRGRLAEQNDPRGYGEF